MTLKELVTTVAVGFLLALIATYELGYVRGRLAAADAINNSMTEGGVR